MSTAVLSRPREPVSARTPSRGIYSLGALLLLGAVTYVVFIAPVHQVDLEVFLRAGQAVLHGHDPYSSTHSETIRTNAAFVYPVAVAWWFAPLSAAGAAAHPLYAVASLLAIAGACWWARPGRPLIAALVLLSSCAVIGLQDGSVNPWLLLGLIAAWRWRDRAAVVGLVVAALIVCKLFLWPVLGWLLLSRRYRAASVTLAATAVVLVAGWTFGPLGSRGYASMLHVLSGLEAPHAAGLSGLLMHWHASLTLATVVSTGIALLVIAFAGLQLRRRPGAGSEVLLFGSAVVAALFASPIVWHHYYLLLAAPLLLATRSAWPFVVLSLASWAAAAPHTTTPTNTAIGYIVGLGGIVVIALITAFQAWRQPAAAAPNPGTRVCSAVRTGRPVAVVAIAAILIAVGVSALENVSVGSGWGALVTVVEASCVLAYVWSRRADSPQVDRSLARSN